MISKIATTAVFVDDPQKAREFWTSKVGFVVHKEKPMGPDATWLEVGPEDAESCLVIYPKALMEAWKDHKPAIVFECEDLQATFEWLRERGVEFTQSPTHVGWGPFASFVDPEGNWFGMRQAE